jgi:hypothetical protein
MALLIVAAATSSSWPILDEIATTVSVYATLIGTLLTASSVYLPTNTRDPDPVSKVFTARIVILGVVAAFGYIWVGDGTLPPHLINGFAILAISGALFRLLSR